VRRHRSAHSQAHGDGRVVAESTGDGAVANSLHFGECVDQAIVLAFFKGRDEELMIIEILNRGYAVDSGRWCGSNGSADGRGIANFANGVWVRTWRHKPLAARMARGGSRTPPLFPLRCPTPTLRSSGFRPWSCALSLIRRTAVCGPACTVGAPGINRRGVVNERTPRSQRPQACMETPRARTGRPQQRPSQVRERAGWRRS
jgi:hypothetical protein